MSKFKNAVYVIGFIFLGILIEIFRQTTHIPVTILDLILFPFCAFIIFYVIWSLLFKRKANKIPPQSEPLSTLKMFGVFTTGIGMLALGAWGRDSGAPSLFFRGERRGTRLHTGAYGNLYCGNGGIRNLVRYQIDVYQIIKISSEIRYRMRRNI